MVLVLVKSQSTSAKLKFTSSGKQHQNSTYHACETRTTFHKPDDLHSQRSRQQLCEAAVDVI